ncbi:hypothetical protein ACQP2F_29985 [Actinoplanes sp. CA-030573]|uniref:hypothetical protein n=1 Tax=Actinoplanes sp. CA-030573 TaxID=3239898 RepID=UPI003D8DA16B
MTALDTLQEALEETTAVAADYQVPEHRVRVHEERFRETAARHGFLPGAMQRTILDVAAQHHAECDREHCRTCDTIRHGLTTTLAALRVAVAAERGPRLVRKAS